MPCWIRSFWKFLGCYKFKLDIGYPTQEMLWEADALLIDLFQQHTKETRRLIGLQCHIQWNLLSLSDTVGLSGRQIEERFTQLPNNHNHPNSQLEFQEERPTDEDWEMWKEFWNDITNTELYLVALLVG